MAANRSSAWVRWVVVLVLLGAGFAGARAYFRKPATAATTFKTGTVSRGDIVQSVTANGSLTAVRNVEVGSQISGTVSNLMADFNSRVTNGQIIAQIDPASYERSLLQAEAELANARASHRLAKANFDRARDLFASQLIARSDYDQTDAALAQADAMVKMREANVERARVDLSRTTIYAPIDGMVISRKVEIGQTVAASLNAPTLFILATDLSKMRIEAAVSEADVGGVAEDQAVNFSVDAFPRRQFTGVVGQVRFAPTTNQNVVTYTTIVEVDNPDLKLRPGMTANASIVTAERTGVLRVPNASLRFRPPEGAPLRGDTNAPAAHRGTNAPAPVKLAASGPFAGLPEPPWTTEGRRPNPGEREEWLATLKPADRERAQRIMDEMCARMAQAGGMGGMGGGFGGGPGGGGGGGFGAGMGGGAGGSSRAAESDGPRTQTLYLVETEKDPAGGERTVLRATPVRLGISDGSVTEVLEGLKENDLVATGIVLPETAVATPSSSPFGGSPFGGPPRIR